MADEEPTIDLTNLPEPEGGFKHDLYDVMTHTWEEVSEWKAFAGVTGEQRIIKCSEADCPVLPMIEMRAVDPDNPLPVISGVDELSDRR